MKLNINFALIVVACITTTVLAEQQQAQYCVTPENYNGSCVALSFCPQIANVIQSGSQTQVQQYIILSQRACGTRSVNGETVVCCTRPYVVPQATTRPQSQTICRGPDLKAGTCMPIRDCKPLAEELLVKQQDRTFARFLKASNSICGGEGTAVCCPSTNSQPQTSTNAPLIKNSDEIPHRLPTVEEGCGVSNNTYKLKVGGEQSRKGAWPWIALIGYDDELSTSPFKCGGTLITARHVVTAAHCLRTDLSFVRLGELDLTTDTEGRHVDIRVVRSEKHPDYSPQSGHSDIAILYLEHNVEFTELISPICMPITPELRQKSYVRYTPYVIGWGKTIQGGTSSNVLQELQIPIYENQVCRDRYKQQNRIFVENQYDKAVLCAGALSGRDDTCQGDSGGPLVIPERYGYNYRFYLIGVVSYGFGCSRPEIPGVYSSTQYFIDWIIQKVADTP
ncbi:LOW QUALITY PROTEIN: venom protease-like [Lucilia sericata]|uniref:LOW QUALITY PROTEIN: venom protease-like n=1 Tax=Lucilia sericata TaxID=13632 RepID=UPI0018A84E25|nr:LOW QUALITY PROTEIN: venom protease-like [Lucilia sericata]